MSWVTIIMDSDEKKGNMDWFYPKKNVLDIVREDQFLYIYIYIYIYLLNLFTSLVLLLIVFFSFFFNPPPPGSSFSFILSSFHLHPPRVDQVACFDPYPINTFLKSLGIAVRLKITIQVSFPH